MRLALTGILLALALPATASAGGWMTVGLTPPRDVAAGDTWTAEMTVLQHGRTPWTGGPVTLTVTAGGERETFRAEETGEPGHYRAAVTVPAGDWTYSVRDPFGADHGFPPVEAATAGAATAVTAQGDGGADPWAALLIAAAATALLAAFAAFALRRSGGLAT